MNRSIRSGLLLDLVLDLLVGVLALMVTGSVTHADTPRSVLNDVRIEPRLGQTVPRDATFLDHTGAEVRLGSLLDERPVVLCLVYFQCPMLCKLAAEGLLRALAVVPEVVGSDFDVWLVSFDPRDTPEDAAAARETALERSTHPEAASGWHCLTGAPVDIAALTESVGFHYKWDPASKQYAHAAGLVVLTRDGTISSYLPGVNYAPGDLSKAVRAATAGMVEENAPTNFLRCYLYDPLTGRFGAAVQWTIRGLGLLTVGVLAIGIMRMSRRGPVPPDSAESPSTSKI